MIHLNSVLLLSFKEVHSSVYHPNKEGLLCARFYKKIL